MYVYREKYDSIILFLNQCHWLHIYVWTSFNLKQTYLHLPLLAYLLNQMSALHLYLPPPGPPYDYDTANVNIFSNTASTI